MSAQPSPSVPTPSAVALERLEEGRRVVAATLIETVGSAPLDPGAVMLVDDAGGIEGSVTGGCVEGALVEEARAVLAGGPAKVVSYGISDSEAADVGLMCGGTVRLFVHEIEAESREALEAAQEAFERSAPVALVTLLDGEHAGRKIAVTPETVVGSFDRTELLDRSAIRDARGFLDVGITGLRSTSGSGETMGAELSYYIQSFATPPSMIIFGAIDFSVAVARMAQDLGYRVTICDAREAFASSSRYSRYAEVVVDWPDRYLAGRRLGPRDAVLVFTHDRKFDEPALMAALSTRAGYIGALGSRRTQSDRAARLRELGATEEDLARIAGPCGLDIGARTPAETAISILAEVISARTGRAGSPLASSDVAIHPREATALS